jgi:hypothetical protein
MEVPARLCGDMEPENDKNKERMSATETGRENRSVSLPVPDL